MGPELLGEDAWTALFSTGDLVENPSIYMYLYPYYFEVEVEVEDQNGIPRPANTLSDIGAYEYFSPPCFGDISEDGDVDGADFLKWQQGYPTGSGATKADGDADGDGDVDGQDFLIWQQWYPYP